MKRKVIVHQNEQGFTAVDMNSISVSNKRLALFITLNGLATWNGFVDADMKLSGKHIPWRDLPITVKDRIAAWKESVPEHLRIRSGKCEPPLFTCKSKLTWAVHVVGLAAQALETKRIDELRYDNIINWVWARLACAGYTNTFSLLDDAAEGTIKA